ncbi:MAG: hypothetical protein FWG05_04485, partial [Kiritimatiellaeota bacterium]|nr:hypothetical protein [Kiritimatiellota bacterium]
PPPLVLGEIIIGSLCYSPPDPATLTLTPPAGPAAIYMPILSLEGFFNAGKLNVGADVQVSVGHLDGIGTVQLDIAPGARVDFGDIDYQTFTSGMLSPYAVTPSGDYFEKTPSSGIVAINDYTGFNVFTGTSLAADTNAAAARVTGALDLGGNTLTVKGAILTDGASVRDGEMFLTADNYSILTYLFVPAGAYADISADITGDKWVAKFGAGKLTLNSLPTTPFYVQEGTLTLACSGIVENWISGAGTLEVAPNTEVIWNGYGSVINHLNLPDRAHLIVDNMELRILTSAYLNSGSTLTLTNGARMYNGTKPFYVGDVYGANSVLTVTGDGTILDMNDANLVLSNGGDDRNVPSYHSIIIADKAVVVNAARVGRGTENGQHGHHNLISVSGGAEVYARGLNVGYCEYYDTAVITDPDTVWDNGGGEVLVTRGEGGHPSMENRLFVTNGAVLRNVGKVTMARRDRHGGSTDNLMYVGSGARVESADTITVAESSSENGHVSQNEMRVDGDGTTWDAGGGLLLIGSSGGGFADNNAFVIENGAAMTGVGAVILGLYHSRDSYANKLVVTNGASLTSFGTVSVGYRNPGGGGFNGYDNSVLIAGGSIGESVWDMCGAVLHIGDNADSGGHYATGNTFTLAAGGVVNNAGAINVGRTPSNRSNGNALVLAGGEMFADSLTVNTSNRLEVVLCGDGVKPVVLDENATLAADSFIVPKLADKTLRGVWWPIIIANGETGVSNSATLAPEPGDDNDWRIRLSSDATTLSICAMNSGTLLILR